MRYQIEILSPETTRTGGIGARFRQIISLAVRGLLWPRFAFQRRRQALRRREDLARWRKMVHEYAAR
jgi:hypothetical protein